MSSKIKFNKKISDDTTKGNIAYGEVSTTAIHSSNRSPEDNPQIFFNDDDYRGEIGKAYPTVSLEVSEETCFNGFIRNFADAISVKKPSTSIEFHGMHTYNSRANTDAFYTIYNDPYGVLTWGSDAIKKPTAQLTGFVREQYNRKMILLGNNVNRATIDYKFHPEWYITKRLGTNPFTNTPLVPANTLTDDHTSFLIMDRLGQKFYMSETQQMLQEAKGFRLNVYDTAPVMKYEGTYNWGTHRPTTLETEIGVSLMPEDKHIIFSMPEKTLKIDLDGNDATGKIVITAGTTTLTITKDGDIDISGSGDLNITTTGDVVFNSGTHAVVADGDIVTYGVGNNIGKLTTMAGSINYAVGLVGMVPIVPAPATVIDSSYPVLVKLENGDIQTAKQGTRKEMVE